MADRDVDDVSGASRGGGDMGTPLRFNTDQADAIGPLWDLGKQDLSAEDLSAPRIGLASGAMAAVLGAITAEKGAHPVAAGSDVLRSDLPIHAPSGIGAAPDWANGRGLGEVLREDRGELDQVVKLIRFPVPQATSVRRQSGTTPTLRLNGAAIEAAGPGEWRFGKGTIWMPAPLADSSAPAGSWFGLTVKRGVLRVASGTIAGDVLVVPDNANVSLQVTLDPRKPASGTGPGAVARAADVRPPSEATFSIVPTGITLESAAAAGMKTLGATVRLAAGGPKSGRYVPVLRSILLAGQPKPDKIDVSGDSTLARISDGGPITEAGWAIPVTVADPASLGEARGSGAVVTLVEGLRVDSVGQARFVGPIWIMAEPGTITLVADGLTGATQRTDIVLYPDPGGKGSIGGRASLRYPESADIRFVSDAGGTELWSVDAAIDLSLDRPVTTSGRRVSLSGTGSLIVLADASGSTIEYAGWGDTGRRWCTALENAVLTVERRFPFALRAKLTAAASPLAASGGTFLGLLPIVAVLPTLPDPYAATFEPRPQRVARPSMAFVADTADRSTARTDPGSLVVVRVDWDLAASATPGLTFRSLRSETFGGAIVARDPGADRGDLERLIADDKDTELLTALEQGALRAAGSIPGPIALLDVSSVVDQFGVRYGLGTGDRERAAYLASPTQVAGPVIDNLQVMAPAHTIRVITTPSVQWEAVSGPAPSGPFSPMDFPDSGGETQIVSRASRLVPVAPRPALAQIVDDYRDANDPAGAVIALSFPYGIRAVALLEPGRDILIPGSDLDNHRPTFGHQNLEGGHQLQATAPIGIIALPHKARSRSFPGAAVQLSNGRHNGIPTGLSPIDPLTDIFNGDFAPSGVRPGVPVEQFDISGYGESVFSDWRDDTDDVPAISEVRFDVLVGRTSLEVVQARSILYPYAVRVIRTIKFIRENSGRVRRTDSGWQATTDGRYRWPRSDTRTHPGVVRGVTHVTNIRDLGQNWTSPDGTELMAVRFDALVDLEGTVAGGSPDGVPARDQLGWIQTSVNPQPGMAATEFAALIDAFGPLGGPLDAVVSIGGSTQRHRVARVGVGVSNGPTGPEFAMAAWGGPVLPKGGSWSVVQRRGSDAAPTGIDSGRGVPLIRAGVAGTSPAATSPYRFADPADLDSPSAPSLDYGLLHATEGRRVLFERPKVNASGGRAGEITSTVVPRVADPFLMATSGVGPFPAVDSAIAFPSADFGLRAANPGALALDLPQNDFAVTGPDRVIHDAGGTTFLARYRDEGGSPSTVHVEIDSEAANPWAFQLRQMELCLATSLMGEVIRLAGSVDGSAQRQTAYTGGTIHFGNALSSIEMFTDFLGTTNLADLPIGSRNQPSLEISLQIPIVGGPGEPEDIDVGIGTLADADVKVGMKIDLLTGSPSLGFTLEGLITGRTPWPPIVAAGQVKFEIESDDEGNVFTFTLGFGVGVQADIGPFKAEAYFLQNDYFVVGTNEIGFGVGIELKASIDLEVVSAEVDVEARALLIQTSCGADTTLWQVAQLNIGVDITIAWVIDIEFDYQLQAQTNLDGGPCPEPMV